VSIDIGKNKYWVGCVGTQDNPARNPKDVVLGN